ncbi:energy transducer TonB [Aquabacterium sp.]|jgi:TonB family protein|uniref:energy transducer TonB n=1 Tax=Aquabacterium sp. TaxID=1872578 RepID=UPI002606B7EA|nr:energy transducer TonB [Aquabacterium sp.]MDD2976903.1 energy transducer TonB [Aquabacterium sp.]
MPQPSTAQAADTQPSPPPYVAASLLTIRPRVVGDLLILYPPSAPTGTFKTQVTIHIDEQGRVEQVLLSGDTLPPELANSAISAFNAARFTPGEVDGIPVRSSVQIEIEFDSDEMQLQ